MKLILIIREKKSGDEQSERWVDRDSNLPYRMDTLSIDEQNNEQDYSNYEMRS